MRFSYRGIRLRVPSRGPSLSLSSQGVFRVCGSVASGTRNYSTPGFGFRIQGSGLYGRQPPQSVLKKGCNPSNS